MKSSQHTPAEATFLLFDLDGTLTDPMLGITRCVAYALARLGREVADLSTLTPYIGPPLKQSFCHLGGLSEQEAERAVAYYRERFAPVGIYENRLYKGITDLLALLRQQGRRLYLATSKPTCYAQQILDHFHLSNFFDYVGGSNLDGTRTRKEEVIAHVLEQNPMIDVSKAVMIGDRCYDMEGAIKHGILPFGVLYGFGSQEELLQSGAINCFSSVEDLKCYFSEL